MGDRNRTGVVREVGGGGSKSSSQELDRQLQGPLLVAGPPPPHIHTHCLEKEASSVVRLPQAPQLLPPELNEILVQSCRRWGLATEAPQSFCSHPKGGLGQGWGPGS